MLSKKAQLIGVVVVIAVIGVIAGVIVTRQSDSSSSATESSGTASSGSGSSVSGGTSDSSTTTSSGSTSKPSKRSNSTSSRESSITSDPTSAKFSLAAFAVGDWGTTIYQDSCCTRSDTYTNFDIVAEDVVASLMNTQAGNADIKPKAILGHGDNFYWTGINSKECTS
ncbi:hypothetical protein PC116_g12512 [Phytophthora cactorum]|nr:hypothetical protein PC116_g12512 [Phytophthora cactorum]